MVLNAQDEVLAAFQLIANHDLYWLLLSYRDDSDDLTLYGSGSGGLFDLKKKMDDPSRIFVAFHKDNLGFILINYIPYSVTGLRRARILVQSRGVAALFRVDYASLTVDNLGNLTPTSIHKATRNPTIPHLMISEMDSPETVRRSFSEFYSPSTSRPATMPKSQSMFSNFIRRTKRSHTLDEQTLPPPPPPKDDIKYTSRGLPTRGPISEFAVIESGNFGSDDEDIVVVSQPDPRPSQFSLPSKWASDSVVIADPAERARRRRMALKERELEEAQAIEEEKDRQARIKLRKEEMLREEQRQEAERQAMVDKEIKRAQAERRRKEQLEKEEDERKRIELAARKADAKLKRQQEHARLEEWRRAQRASAEESSKREAELNRQERAEKEKRLKQMEVKVKSTLRAGETGQGWVSIQASESIVWRRRYYKVYGDVIYFYRSPKEMDQALDQLTLRGKLSGLREWNEGYEELKALPHSFAIEFKDGRGSWSMYTDTEDDKFRLLALLKTTAGL